MLPSFADFESQTRLNTGMVRLFEVVVNENATRAKSRFIFPAPARQASCSIFVRVLKLRYVTI
jgi:hypothetical protein